MKRNRERLALPSPRQRQHEAEIEEAGDSSDPIGDALTAWRTAYEERYRKEQPEEGMHPTDDQRRDGPGLPYGIARIEDRVERPDAKAQRAPYPPVESEHFYRAKSARDGDGGGPRGVFVLSMATLEEEPE